MGSDDAFRIRQVLPVFAAGLAGLESSQKKVCFIYQ